MDSTIKIPKILYFICGGKDGYTIRFDGDEYVYLLRHTKSLTPYQPDSVISGKFTPSNEAWCHLLTVIDNIGVWTWTSDYISSPPPYDWTFAIADEERYVKCRSASNSSIGSKKVFPPDLYDALWNLLIPEGIVTRAT